MVIIVNVEGKSRVKKHLHTAGGNVERRHEKRSPVGGARSGQVEPALLFFFRFQQSMTSDSIETDDERCSLEKDSAWEHKLLNAWVLK